MSLEYDARSGGELPFSLHYVSGGIETGIQWGGSR